MGASIMNRSSQNFTRLIFFRRNFISIKEKRILSTLICSGQMTRSEALLELEKPLYEPAQLQSDKEYVMKKFGLSPEQFEKIMHLPVKKHSAFKSDRKLKERYMNMLIRTAPVAQVISKN